MRHVLVINTMCNHNMYSRQRRITYDSDISVRYCCLDTLALFHNFANREDFSHWCVSMFILQFKLIYASEHVRSVRWAVGPIALLLNSADREVERHAQLLNNSTAARGRVNAEESGARRKSLYRAPVPFAGPPANATLYDVHSYSTSGGASSLPAGAQSAQLLAVHEIHDKPMRRACGQVTSHAYGHDSRVYDPACFSFWSKPLTLRVFNVLSNKSLWNWRRSALHTSPFLNMH